MLTPRQRELLGRIAAPPNRAHYVYGADLRVAQRLVELGLVELEDNGDLRPEGRIDGERWCATPTPAGIEAAK